MQYKKLHHIGIASRKENVKKWVDFFISIGGKLKYFDTCHHYMTDCTFIKLANVYIEIISDFDGGEIIKRFLDKHEEGIHHLAYINPNLISNIKGALPNMKINFLPIKKDTKILIEEVRFDV